MLYHREEAILGGRTLTLALFIENAEAKGVSNDRVRDSKNLVELYELLFLDESIGEDKAFELKAEGVGQLADQLLVSGTDIAPIMPIILNTPLHKVRV